MKQAKGGDKQADIALNEERLRLALKVANQAWFDVNVKTGEVHVSPEYAGLIGFSPEQFETSLQNWMEHLHPDDRAGVMAAFQSCLASSDPVTMEYRRQTSFGEWAWMRSIGEVVEWDDAKQPVRMIGVHMLISDKKQAEETVEASKHLIDSIVENAPIRIFWKDRDSTYLGCNSLFARDAGLSGPEELIGKSDFDMGWKDQAELYRADDAAVMDSCVPKLGFEEPQTTPDGNTIWLRTSKVPLLDDAGTVVGILGVYEDITEHKQAEQNLKESEIRYKNMIDFNPLMCFELDSTGVIKNINREAISQLGYPAEELIGQPVTTVFPAKMHEAVRTQVDTCIRESDRVHKWEITKEHKDGHLLWVSETAITIQSDQQNPTILIMCENIDERKQTELALIKSEALLSITQAAAEMGTWDWNIPTGHVEFNQRWAEMRGYRLDEIKPDVSSWESGISPDDLPTIQKLLSEHFEGHTKLFEAEYRVLNNSGQWIWILDRGKMVEQDSDGKPLRMTGVEIDITARKEAESAFQTVFEGITKPRNRDFFLELVSTLCEWLGADCAIVSEYVSEGHVRALAMQLDGKPVEGYEYDLIGSPCGDVDEHGFCAYAEGVCQAFPNDKDLADMKAEGYFGVGLKNEAGESNGILCVISRNKLSLQPKTKQVFEIIAARAAVEVERRQFEEALKISNEQLSFALQGANDGLWDWNIETNEVYYSPRWKSMLGYGEDDLGNTLEVWKELVDPEQMESILQHVTNYIEGKLPRFESEFRMRHKDGHWVDILARARLAMDESGNELAPRRLIGTHVDISDRKHVERELKYRLDEIERMNKLMIGRELKMEELRQEISRLKKEKA